ncbi:MAG TPA: peptide ABC transporter substrate-binding protein [Woeseiaceae bacterium]|nr:peptide ABC transporter substrate-binding protein [Woeseiaceae bacterium]
MPRLLTLLMLALLAAGCGDRAPDGSRVADEGVTFHRGNGAEPATLDPHRAEDSASFEILRDLYEGLTTGTVEAKVVPGTAESWDVSPNGLTWTFTLRADAAWSNGDPVTATDFVAGFRRTVDPATASTYAQVLFPVKNAGAVNRGDLPPEALGVSAPDGRTFVVELAAPTPYFLSLLTHSATYPLHRASFAVHGEDFVRAGNMVSNGAYALDEWAVNSFVRLRRNPYYHGAENVQIDTVYYYPIEEHSAELQRYRAGELDFTQSVPNNQYDWIQANLGDELHVTPYLSTYFFVLDLTERPFDDARVRQALAMAVDRQTLVEKVLGGGQQGAWGLVPPGVDNYASAEYEWRDWPEERRLAEARRLYREAGYSADNPLEARILYNTSDNHRKIAVAVQEMIRSALGADITVVNQEFKVMLETRKEPSRWEILRYGWTGDYNDPYTFLEIFRSDSPQNPAWYANPEFDRLLENASEEVDMDRRARLLRDAEQLLINDYPVIFAYFYVARHLVKPWVSGYRANIMDHNYSRHYRIERPVPEVAE